jgi:hypothetical protein
MKNRRKVRRSVKPRNNNGSESPLIDILPRDSANLFARLTNVTGGRHLEAILVRMPPGQERSEVTTHAGEEFVYVITGQVSLTLDGKTFESCAREIARITNRRCRIAGQIPLPSSRSSSGSVHPDCCRPRTDQPCN